MIYLMNCRHNHESKYDFILLVDMEELPIEIKDRINELLANSSEKDEIMPGIVDSDEWDDIRDALFEAQADAPCYIDRKIVFWRE